MKKRSPVALVSAGNLTDSPLTRFWGLHARLGPVKSSSLRIASRMANTLRAGHAVKTYDEFNECSLVLLCLPGDSVPAAVEELANSGVSWRNKAAVLCSAYLDGGELHKLALQGASVGAITPIPGFEDRRYLVDGDQFVVREMRSLVEHRGTRVIPIESALKPLFLAGLTCTGPLLFSLLIAAAECIRPAGISADDVAAIIERQVELTARAYLKAGRKAYQSPRELARQLQALEEMQPALAGYVEQTARVAAAFLDAAK